MNNADWIEIGQLDDIPRQGARVVKTGAGTIAVFRTHDDQVYALKNKCPHKGGPLADGLVHDHAVTCPLHGWCMSLTTGVAREPDVGRVPRYPVELRDGRLFLGLAPLPLE